MAAATAGWCRWATRQRWPKRLQATLAAPLPGELLRERAQAFSLARAVDGYAKPAVRADRARAGGCGLGMCGICGFLGPGLGSDAAATLQAMVDQLRHRGPDDAGIWLDPDAGAALGHTRLAVVDLSPAGHQPMVSADGRWIVSYNGEIYNAGDLRTDLEARGIRLRGHSDTEILVEAVAIWG